MSEDHAGETGISPGTLTHTPSGTSPSGRTFIRQPSRVSGEMTRTVPDAIDILAVKVTARREHDDSDSPTLTIRDDDGGRIEVPISRDTYDHLAKTTKSK